MLPVCEINGMMKQRNSYERRNIMYISESKKMIILYILEILMKYTDEDHRLSQKEIADILMQEYHVKTERKAINRYLMDLKDYLEDSDYTLLYSETVRKVPILLDRKTKDFQLDPETGERVLVENIVYSDFYLERPFSDSELRLLIDGILFSNHMTKHQRKTLAEKLCGLSSVSFKHHVNHIACAEHFDVSDNQELFLNIEVLDEAIEKNRKVSFKYVEYGTDKKAHIKTRPDGTERVYIVSPYQMVAKDGKYYLICNYDKYEDISNYRIDRIKGIKILDEPAKAFASLEWSKGRKLDLAEYMKEHVYMYSSGNVRVTFRIVKPMMIDVIDLFGKDVMFFDEDETHVKVSVNTAEAPMLQFAKNFAPDVEILEPASMRDKMREELERALEVYR